MQSYTNTFADNKLIEEHEFYKINYREQAFGYNSKISKDKEST